MASDTNGKQQPPPFQVHYIKTYNYREIVCDGLIGGITPQANKIWMGFYSERNPIPRTVFHQAAPGPDPNQYIVDESSPPYRVESREGIIRTVEVTTYVDVATAKRFVDWLQKRISELEGKKNG